MKLRLIVAASCLAVMTSCRIPAPPEPTPTPLPGWRLLVSDLLLGDEAFPEGWTRIRDLPQAGLTDLTINHVYRSWWGQDQGNGKADQAIWRAYTVAAAEKKYADLRQSQFYLRSTLPPDEFFVEFAPPDEIDFQSGVASEFYLACGWRIWAHCDVIARYRNYVTSVSLDLEAEQEGHVSHGLTYAETEAIVRAMDAKFAEAMGEFYPPSQ